MDRSEIREYVLRSHPEVSGVDLDDVRFQSLVGCLMTNYPKSNRQNPITYMNC